MDEACLLGPHLRDGEVWEGEGSQTWSQSKKEKDPPTNGPNVDESINPF